MPWLPWATTMERTWADHMVAHGDHGTRLLLTPPPSGERRLPANNSDFSNPFRS